MPWQGCTLGCSHYQEAGSAAGAPPLLPGPGLYAAAAALSCQLVLIMARELGAPATGGSGALARGLTLSSAPALVFPHRHNQRRRTDATMAVAATIATMMPTATITRGWRGCALVGATGEGGKGCSCWANSSAAMSCCSRSPVVATGACAPGWRSFRMDWSLGAAPSTTWRSARIGGPACAASRLRRIKSSASATVQHLQHLRRSAVMPRTSLEG
ncbi:hypothetical protein V8C86DRAFT_2779507 [Haematococcus lacustris]